MIEVDVWEADWLMSTVRGQEASFNWRMLSSCAETHSDFMSPFFQSVNNKHQSLVAFRLKEFSRRTETFFGRSNSKAKLSKTIKKIHKHKLLHLQFSRPFVAIPLKHCNLLSEMLFMVLPAAEALIPKQEPHTAFGSLCSDNNK